jgi:Flp pilus assembly protein TadB
MSEHCGSVTADGAAVCVPGACSCSTETKSSAPILLALPPAGASKNTNSLNGIAFKDHQEQTMWQKIRSGVMFGVACMTSPCCTPILVPIGLALLAGTPVAAWVSANVGWVYGGLTLFSVISLVLGFRWMGQKNESKRKRIGQALPESNH